MPRCNFKKTLFSVTFSLLCLLVLFNCHQFAWFFSVIPWKVKIGKITLAVPKFQKDSKVHSFLAKSVINLHSTKTVFNLDTEANQSHKSSQHITTTFQNSTFLCGKHGILTIKSGGRLGNLMGEYATLWALAKRDGLLPVAQHRTYTTLKKYFLHPSIPDVVNMNCSKLKWNSMNLLIYNKLEKEERRSKAKEGIFIDGYPTSVSLFHRHRSYIMREFQFKEKFIERAQSVLRRLRGNRQHVTFIGVHVRRTDYSQFLEERFQAQLVGETYFTRAMNYFRNKFPTRLFVVASDDMDWCLTHLKPVGDDIVFASNNNRGTAAEDMALLTACNHSIISYGNFGFWSAYLSGGEVILAGNISLRPTELQHSIRSANITGWQFFSGL